MQPTWGTWSRGRLKAKLTNGQPLPWMISLASREEIATTILARIPYQIVGDVEWLIERGDEKSVPDYTLRIRGGQSPLELHQRDADIRRGTIHGMSISHDGKVNFAIGLDDRFRVEINLQASK